MILIPGRNNRKCTEEEQKALDKGRYSSKEEEQMFEQCQYNCVLGGGFFVPCAFSCAKTLAVEGGKISAKCGQCIDEYILCSKEKCHVCRKPLVDLPGLGALGMMIRCEECVKEKCKGKGRECGISINELFRGSA